MVGPVSYLQSGIVLFFGPLTLLDVLTSLEVSSRDEFSIGTGYWHLKKQPFGQAMAFSATCHVNKYVWQLAFDLLEC